MKLKTKSPSISRWLESSSIKPVQDGDEYVSASDGVVLIPLVTLLDLSKRPPGRSVRQLRDASLR